MVTTTRSLLNESYRALTLRIGYPSFLIFHLAWLAAPFDTPRKRVQLPLE
jgi:hypothetical protein